MYILCQGWVASYIRLGDGRRQILSIRIGGDLFSSKLVFQGKLDSTILAITNIRFSRLHRSDLKKIVMDNEKVLDALAKVCVEEGMAADQLIVDLGRRSAEVRIARFILFLTRKLGQRYVVRDHRYPFPMRQQDIADLLGLTPVHVNRVLGGLRKAHIIETSRGMLAINRMSDLERIAQTYEHV